MDGVYLVKPSWMALMPACLMSWGVSKSGSPAAKLTTSLPCPWSSLALAVMANVVEPTISLIRRLTLTISSKVRGLTAGRLLCKDILDAGDDRLGFLLVLAGQ